MEPVIRVEPSSNEVVNRRVGIVRRVLDNFPGRLPSHRLLIYLANDSSPLFKERIADATRGLHFAVTQKAMDEFVLAGTPLFRLLSGNGSAFAEAPPYQFDCVIWVRESTCNSEVGLTMNVAHELQHFVQHWKDRKMLDFTRLAYAVIERKCLNKNSVVFKWHDLPAENDARIVEKKVALSLLNGTDVERFIDERIARAEAVSNEIDAEDWKYRKRLGPDSCCDVWGATRALYARLVEHKELLEEIRCSDTESYTMTQNELANMYP